MLKEKLELISTVNIKRVTFFIPLINGVMTATKNIPIAKLLNASATNCFCSRLHFLIIFDLLST